MENPVIQLHFRANSSIRLTGLSFFEPVVRRKLSKQKPDMMIFHEITNQNLDCGKSIKVIVFPLKNVTTCFKSFFNHSIMQTRWCVDVF